MGNLTTDLKSTSSTNSQTELTKSEIDVIHVISEADEQDILRWHRQFLKIAPDGIMNFDTFDRFYQCCNPGLNTRAMAKLVFKHLDKRKSGCINFFDFFITNWLYRKADNMSRAKLIFEFCDTDKSGSISLKELAGFLEAIYLLQGKNINQIASIKAMAKEIIEKIDINRDRKLQKSEFVHSMLVDKELSSLISFDLGFDVPKEL
ncbi:hypothetical protein GJ496_010761 [Pomphorhynchus laevis]|nr:hypothetical protein GJ496_010761 [Pomphorhynchus laevis]